MRKTLLLMGFIFSFSYMLADTGHNLSIDSFGADSIPPKKMRVYIQPDTFPTNNGLLKVTLVGHGSLMFEYGDKVIHVDPYSKVTNYSKLPKADLIILTHEHSDHLDRDAIALLKKEDTRFIVSKVCNEMLGYGDIINNKEQTSFEGIEILAVPAYNKEHRNSEGKHYHPKGRGNGYIFTFDNLKVYVAGDTENISDMKKLKGTIDIAFLPKNIPYTMTEDMFVDAANKVMPKYLYPYHYSSFDEEEMTKALEGTGIKLMVRPMSNK